MMHLTLKMAAEELARRSVDSVIVGFAVWLFVSVMLRVVPRQNAASRFTVWLSALIAIAVVPILGFTWSPNAGVISQAAQHAAILVPGSWAEYFGAVWATISVVFLFQLARSVWHLHSLRRTCVTVKPETLDSRVLETLRKHGASRGVRLCTSSQVKVPAAIGLWRPVVVVPRWVMNELSSDELNQIILHEVAHLRRLDDWTNLVQQVVKALFFFHPAVWWIEKKASLEREIACDDAVLAETSTPRAYAECLARLAEKNFAHRSLAMAQAALGKVRQISTRVARILDANRPVATSGVWRPAVSFIAVFAIGSAIWYARSPRLLGFEESVSPASVSSVSAPSAPEPAQASRLLKVTPVRLVEKRRDDTARALPRRTTLSLAKKPRLHSRSLVHLARAKSADVPVTRTVWIVVERNDSTAARESVQIEMWHVTILEVPAASSAPQIPRKI